MKAAERRGGDGDCTRFATVDDGSAFRDGGGEEEDDDKSSSNGAESNALQHQSSDPAGGNVDDGSGKLHLARGWLVSKLPFDVDQPGSERTALEADFNGSVPMLTHSGLFKYDPTPRADGMNYYRRVYVWRKLGWRRTYRIGRALER